MRIVTEEMVELEGARFQLPAQGYFIAEASCPSCGEKRQVTFPIYDVGQEHSELVNCNAGHSWTARAKVIK